MSKNDVIDDSNFSCLFELQNKKKAAEEALANAQQELRTNGKKIYENAKFELEERIKKKKETLISTKVLADEKIKKLTTVLCALGVHIGYFTDFKKSDSEVTTNRTFKEGVRACIAVNTCVCCGKVISAIEYTSMGWGGWRNHKVKIPESEYSTLPIVEVVNSKDAYSNLKIYLKHKDDDLDLNLQLSIWDKDLLEYYMSLHFENPEIKSILPELIKAIDEREKADKDLKAFDEEKKKNQLFQELCGIFGHDIVSTAYENEYVTCKCCGITQRYGSFVKEWEETPFYDAVFEHPVVKPKPEIKTEIRYRDSRRDPEDFNWDD